MSEQAGGVKLEVELNYDKALVALRSFQAEVAKVENSGAQISKMQEALVQGNAMMQKSLSSLQALAAEQEALTRQTEERAAAEKAQESAADAANRAARNAMRAQIKDSEYLNKTLAQRQQILARISAATRGQDVSSLNADQRGVLGARYSNLAVDEFANGGLANSTRAQQQIAEREAQAAAQAAADKEMSAAHAEALKVNKALDDKAAADRIANLETIRALERQLEADSIAGERARNEAIVTLRQAQEAEITAAHSEALKINRTLDAEAAAAQKAESAARVADLETIRLLENQLAVDAVAREQARNDAIVAQRAAEEAELTALHTRALAENAALDKAAAAERAEALAAQQAQMAEAAAEQIAQIQARVAADKVANAERLAQLAAENAALREQMALEAARAAEVKRSADYETSTISSKMKMLKSIAVAEAQVGKLSDNPTIAAKFPTAALSDYAMIGAGSDAYHKFRAELEAVGKGSASAATGIKATAQEARELTTIIKDVITGEWSRFGGSVTRLLTLSGTFDGVLGLVGGSILATGLAMGALAAAAVKGASDQNQLNLALAQTGNYAGVTESGLNDIAESATHMGGTIGEARETVLQLAQSGRYTADQIKLIADAASAIGGAGGNVENFLKQIDGLKDNPTDGVYKLNEQFHFLTASTYEAIAAAERHGDAIKASQLAIEAFADTQEERGKQVIENAGLITRAWHGVKDAISEALDKLLSIGKVETTAEKIATLTAKIQEVKNRPIGEYGINDTSGMERDLADLQKKMELENQNAQTQGKLADATLKQVQATKLLDAERKKLRTPADKRRDEEELLRKGLAPLVGLPADQGGITQKDVDDLVAKAALKYHDKAPKRGHIDPTDYNAAQEQAKLDADALKNAQDLLNIRKQLGLAISEESYAHIEQLALIAQESDYESRREKILKEIKNAERNGNPNSKRQLLDELDILDEQNDAKKAQIELDYDRDEVQRNIQRALLNISTIENSRTTILQAQDALYGNAASMDTARLDALVERVTIEKAQYDQALQMEQLKDSGASVDEVAYAREANSLKLAQQIFEIEKERQKLLMDNAFTIQNVYQQTLNSIDAQIAALEKGRTTLADQAVTGFSGGFQNANNALFQSFKSKDAANKFTTQNYTGEIGSSIYDSITKSLSSELTESTLKGFQGLLKTTGAVSQADIARDKAQQDLALNTQTMTQALSITIPEKLDQLIGLNNGTITPTGPVGNAALPSNQQSATTGSGAPYAFGGGTAQASQDLVASQEQAGKAQAAMSDFGSTSSDVLKQFGLTATSASSLLYTGVIAATSGSSKAIKNYVVYASAQLLELYAIQKLVGLVSSFGASGSEAAGASATSTPDDLIAGYGHADGVASVDKNGYITAPGGPRDDRGLAWLSDGESVLTAAATKYYGADRIARMNKMSLPRFADGRVGAGAGSGAAGGSGISIQFDIDASGSGGKGSANEAAKSGQLQKELESAVLGVFSKYSASGGPIYSTIKQIAGRP
jgi:phage-related minor tail protein